MTCPAIGILPDGSGSLACAHEAPHPGVMHFDGMRGVWWGETDDGVMILDDPQSAPKLHVMEFPADKRN
jgi:hypothetical protein